MEEETCSRRGWMGGGGGGFILKIVIAKGGYNFHMLLFWGVKF